MKYAIAITYFLFVMGCSSGQQGSETNIADYKSNLIGEWQYAGNYGDAADERIPGFLKEHGYIFSEDGKWETRTTPTGFSAPGTGEYALNGDQLMMSGKSIIGGSRKTKIIFEGGQLVMMSDITISIHDKPAETKYIKIQ